MKLKQKLAAAITFSVMTLFFAFQNCAKTTFTTVVEDPVVIGATTHPICDPGQRPQDLEYRACPSPNQNSMLAIERFSAICQSDGTWFRVSNGNLDYALCPKVCNPATRPSDVENVACPAPYASDKKGVQKYTVSCSSSGQWTRTLLGAADYAACMKTCDPNMRPVSSTAIACPSSPSILSGIQNYIVTCNSNGTWSSMLGSVDYSKCPAVCNPNTKPPSSEPAQCPTSTAMSAVQNYDVACSASGMWVRNPTSFDTSKCPAPPTCNPNTKPPASEMVACPSSPSVKSAIQTYSVTCSGTNWVRNPISLNDSSCPKGCTLPVPANMNSAVSCPSPYQATLAAVQSYKYVCNSSSGNYDKVADGSINYSACPKACSGTPPASRVPITCPAGQVGQAYQNYSVTCNSATGQYSSQPTNVDSSGCSVETCTTPRPSDSDPVACPAPFSDRLDAQKKYAVSCVGTAWKRDATGEINTSACPVNDCSGTPNPGTLKSAGSCPGGSFGNVTQICGLSCTGRTWSQVNCMPADYSNCSCGPNATFNQTTKTCVTVAECVNDTSKDEKAETGKSQSCQYGAGGYNQVVEGSIIRFKYCENGRWQNRVVEIAPICPIGSTPVP